MKCIPCEREQHGACDGMHFMCTCMSSICASRRRDVSAWLMDELLHKHTMHERTDTTLYETKTRDEVNTHGEERTDN